MGRRQLDPEQEAAFRERLCEAAMSLIAESGYNAVTMRKLAAELGCSHTTPYRYFADKDEIFMAVRAMGLDRFSAFHERRLARVRGAEAKLMELGRGYVLFARQQHQAFRIIFELDQPAPVEYEPLQLANQRAWSVLLGTVKEAVENDVIAGDPVTLAHLFWSAMHGLASLHLANRLQMGMTASSLTEPMLTALIDAHRPHLL
ncbi:MAG: TetR/AcrR family transcriptional regulator [Myxococcota bacterium]